LKDLWIFHVSTLKLSVYLGLIFTLKPVYCYVKEGLSVQLHLCFLEPLALLSYSVLFLFL